MPEACATDSENLKYRLHELKARLADKQREFKGMAQQKQSDNNGNKRRNSGGYASTFMALFAGEAGLTRAVERRVGTVFNPADIQQNHFVKKSFNLLCKTTFKELKKKIKARQIRWVHLAPPCKTFSRARRRDRHAKARVLRTRTFPGGLWPRSKLVQEANVLASRSAQVTCTSTDKTITIQAYSKLLSEQLKPDASTKRGVSQGIDGSEIAAVS